MRKTLYIHIGNYKTGTSAIQKYLHGMGVGLHDYSLHYFESARPISNPTTHGVFSIELLREFGAGHLPIWYGENHILGEVVQNIKNEIIENSECSSFMLSSEEFIRVSELDRKDEALMYLKNSFLDLNLDIKVMLYVRESLSFALSWYNQITKISNVPTKQFVDFFYDMPEFLLNPYYVYKDWANIFGAENIILKKYQYKGNEHINDFCSSVGLALGLRSNDSSTIINSSLTNYELELIRLFKISGLKDISSANDYLNSEVLSDRDKMINLRDKVSRVNESNIKFFKDSFSDTVQNFDEFDVICLTSKINQINVEVLFELVATLIKRVDELDQGSLKRAVSKLTSRSDVGANLTNTEDNLNINTFKELYSDNFIDIVRDSAVALESNNLDKSLKLMRIVSILRPNGPFIKRKYSDYKESLG